MNLSSEIGQFGFRPWVRRAGLSILAVAAIVTALMWSMVHSSFRYGWVREPFSWIYVAVLWIGGLRIYMGTLKNAAEILESGLILRPLHRFGRADIDWTAVKGTEQMIGGDRLIVYYERGRGLRFIAMNLNLVKRRRQFEITLEERLRRLGFVEKVVERSRYLTRVDARADEGAGLTPCGPTMPSGNEDSP
ncbi:MAG TPA: hypothetical protein VHL58_14040 [Thermoanaerobaculia bacterium]|nr:hypothetical protein [Thermoanaerobaculia bacterium]